MATLAQFLVNIVTQERKVCDMEVVCDVFVVKGKFAADRPLSIDRGQSK